MNINLRTLGHAESTVCIGGDGVNASEPSTCQQTFCCSFASLIDRSVPRYLENIPIIFNPKSYLRLETKRKIEENRCSERFEV